MVCDGARVNLKFGKNTRKFLKQCSAHKLHLAVQKTIYTYDEEI